MRIERAELRSATRLVTAGFVLGLGATAALAAGTGQPEPWQMDMQVPVTNIAQQVYDFHYWVNGLMIAITLFVLALIVAIIVKFNHKANPTPSRTTHHTLLEVAWTIVPVLILVAIAIPSFRVLRTQLVIPETDMTIKVTGHQWYWSIEYPGEQAGFTFDANLAETKDLKPGEPYLLAVDNEALVPVGKNIRVQVTAADVMHNFAVPSLGQRLDAIPGRLNETWFRAEREGVYYGQCSELCGTRHAYMPVAIRVVSEARYAEWLAEAKKKFARIDGSTRLASASNN
jgi:cytochrome c oxidase subunit II